MKWYMYHTTNGVQLYIINKEYALRIFKTKSSQKCVHLIGVYHLIDDDKFKKSKELSDIEMMIINLYDLIKEFIPRIKKLPLYKDCKNNYNKEVIEFKEYFKELEKNSACGEIEVEK